MANELAGKIAVVTGASQGIGKACALAMIEMGARVVVVARDLQKLNNVYAGFGDAAIPVVSDLLREKDRRDLVPVILEKTGHIDTFIANAGMYVGGDLLTNDPQQIEDVLTLNINGVFTPSRAVLAHMASRKTGDLIIMGSIAGRRHPSYEPVYGPSKMAVEEFGDLARIQMSPYGVRVGTISSACVETPLVESWEPERLAKARANGEFISAEEVAEATMYMLTRPRHLAIANVTMAPTAFNKI